jgi:hypothetical protein
MTYQAHATDDQGFPLNPDCCERCKLRAQWVNMKSLAKLFEGLQFSPKNITGEYDYDGDGGREVLESEDKP